MALGAAPVQSGKPKVFSTDALLPGVHSALRQASEHRKEVSAVIHLKKQGGRGNPTAYHKISFKGKSPKAFGKG